jgi:hypothetical protein
MLVISGHADPQNPALRPNRAELTIALDKDVLHFWPFAKYAVAFSRMSRSILTRANSARNRPITASYSENASFVNSQAQIVVTIATASAAHHHDAKTPAEATSTALWRPGTLWQQMSKYPSVKPEELSTN